MNPRVVNSTFFPGLLCLVEDDDKKKKKKKKGGTIMVLMHGPTDSSKVHCMHTQLLWRLYCAVIVDTYTSGCGMFRHASYTIYILGICLPHAGSLPFPFLCCGLFLSWLEHVYASFFPLTGDKANGASSEAASSAAGNGDDGAAATAAAAAADVGGAAAAAVADVGGAAAAASAGSESVAAAGKFFLPRRFLMWSCVVMCTRP